MGRKSKKRGNTHIANSLCCTVETNIKSQSNYAGMCAKSLQWWSLFAILWTVALHASLSMGFSRQEYWSGPPCPPPGDLPDPGIKLMSLVTPAVVSRFFTSSATWEALRKWHMYVNILKIIILLNLYKLDYFVLKEKDTCILS